MGQGDYTWGNWVDSNGDVNRMCFKKKWGEHVFTSEENEELLAGEEVSFLHKGKKITGHLQYYLFKGKEYFGFKSDYPRNEYDRYPVFHQNPRVSSFKSDLKIENDVMAEYMRIYYYDKLLNGDKSRVKDYKRITDVELQKEGVDVTYTMDGRHYIIDEKAQMDYVYKSEPLPTFSLELLNGTSGAIGWFINSELKTEYYMFIWPHADDRPLRLESISYAYYALVSKKRLLVEIEKRYNKSREGLLECAKRMITQKMGEAVKDEAGNCIGYRYKGDGFDNQGYLYYTVKKKEHPVNLVVKRSWLDALSEAHGLLVK